MTRHAQTSRAALRPGHDPDDLHAWAEYVRHVVPRLGRARPVVPLAPAELLPQGVAPLPVPPPRPPPSRAPAMVVGRPPGGLDRASWERLRDGRLRPTRRLDLHGRTAAAAHAALQDFLHAAARDGVRCVEVVTGHGMRSGGGAIRRELPLWLDLLPLRPLVLALAHPHALNPGAVRILLRRRR